MKHTLKEIVKDHNIAKMTYVCQGWVYYEIIVNDSIYQLRIDSKQEEWKYTYLLPAYYAITLMRWIRKGIENDDETFIQIK